MLLLKHLYLQNFMSIDELDIDFDDNEVMAIYGQNGSGKSTLLYAIAFLLTGYRKGESYRDYVKSGCEQAHLYLEAYLNGEPLYCEADLLGNMKKNIMQPTKRKTIYKGVTYLNSDHNQFIKEYDLSYAEPLIFFFQDSSKDIIDARPSERAATLKKLFKFEFTDIVDKLKEEQEQNKISRVELVAISEELKTRNFETQRLSREVLPSVVDQWSKEASDINKTLIKLGDVDKDSLNKVNDELGNVQRNIQSTQSKFDQEESSIKSIEKEIKEKKDSLDREEFKDIEEIKAKVSSLKEEWSQHEIQHSEQQKVVDEISNQINICEFKRSELLKQIERGKAGVCHACGQTVTPDHVEKLQLEESNISKEINDLKVKLNSLYFDREDSKSKELMSNIRKLEDLSKSIEMRLANLDYYAKRLESLQSLQEERKNYLGELKNRESKLLAEKEKYSKIATLLKEKDDLNIQLNTLQEKINKAKEEKIRNIERKKNNEVILQEKAKCEAKLDEVNGRINELIKNLNTTKSAIDIFESSFPAFLVLQATQKLEDHINEVVQRVFPYMRVKLQMQRAGVTFMYTAESSEDEWLPVSMASGAQKAVLSLAYRISLARLYGISCVMLDEVDASCTAKNAEIVYKFVASLKCFKQLIFISHRPESLEAAKEVNPNVIIYTVDKGAYEVAGE